MSRFLKLSATYRDVVQFQPTFEFMFSLFLIFSNFAETPATRPLKILHREQARTKLYILTNIFHDVKHFASFHR